MSRAYLGLGSNMGDKRKYMDGALELLEKHPDIYIIKASSYYITSPVGYTDQEDFLNRVVVIDTVLSPHELLAYCNKIEQKLKRERLIRWGPRTIDIDILLYGDMAMTDERLTIPHPRMTERAFVMIPLYEIDQNLVISGQQIEKIVDKLDKEGIRMMNDER